jgi:hypothetical protein
MATEKRLIDANALAKEIDYEYDLGYGEILTDPRRFAEMVEDAPTVDAVEVVRCKDCKRYSQSGLCNLYCNISLPMNPDDFCSYGERRTDNA